MSKVYNVVFLQKWDVFQPGERAGFVKELADNLIGRRLAQAYEPMPSAQKGEDLPEAGMSSDELKRVKESRRVLKLQEEAADREAQMQAKRSIFPGQKHKG